MCSSNDPRNKRLRTALYLEAEGVFILVDTPPDFREQALKFRLPRVDAVLFTHSHADHVFGFDDIRRYNTLQDSVIPAYGSADTIADLKRIFDYIGLDKLPGLYRPRIDFREIDGALKIGAVSVEALRVPHGSRGALGYLFSESGKRLAYFPDCAEMPDSVIERLKGVDVMILDALRHRPHKTHLTVEASIAALKRIGARASYLIHMGHDLDHDETQASLPDGIYVSYDGLTVEP